MFTMLRVNYPSEEPVALKSLVLLVNLQSAPQVVLEVVVAQLLAGDAARLVGAAPEELADLQ